MASLDPAWLEDAAERGGAVVVLPPGVGALMAVRQFATDKAVAMSRLLGRPATYPLRVPHHSVSARGLVAEIPAARGGALVLDDVQEVDAQALETLALSPTVKRRELVVFAFARIEPKQATRALQAGRQTAALLGLPLFVWDGSSLVEAHVAGVGGGPSAPDVVSDLAQINAHRRRMYMAPLDPASAGWNDDDVRLEAARLRAAGNPARADLLSWSAP